MPHWIPPTVVAVFSLALAALTLPGALWLLAAVGGWRSLAERFPRAPAAPGADSGLGSISIGGWCNYNLCVRWRADDEHLHLSILPIVAFFHAPMSIPWAEIDFGSPGRRRSMVRGRVGNRTLWLQREMVRRELEVRAAVAEV